MLIHVIWRLLQTDHHALFFQEFTCTDAEVNKVTLKSIGNSQEVLQELEKLSGNVSGDRKRRNIVFTPGATSCEQGSASSGEYCGEFSEKMFSLPQLHPVFIQSHLSKALYWSL